VKIRKDMRYEITPLTFNRARIILTDGYSVEEGW